MERRGFGDILRLAILCGLSVGLAVAARAQDRKQDDQITGLEAKAFADPKLYPNTSTVELTRDNTMSLANRTAVDAFFDGAVGGTARLFMDPRTQTLTTVLGAVPLLPGEGRNNRETLARVSQRLGRSIARIDRQVVADVFRRHVLSQSALLGIDPTQLSTEVRVEQVSRDIWQVSIPQVYRGIPVRDGRVLGTFNRGNLVMFGAQDFCNVSDLAVQPRISAAEAQAVAFAFADGFRSHDDTIARAPALEVIPFEPADGSGRTCGHELIWKVAFHRESEGKALWEAQVDAHRGTLLAFQDANLYVEKTIKGGVYPLTNTGVCPDLQHCGVMQPDTPMPWANTGTAAPILFTDGAGTYDFLGTPVTTTLSGRYIRVQDQCGAVSETSSSGDLDLGGANNQHDCTSAGSSPGNTPATRSAFYELNKIHEQARGWLPTNPWLNTQLTAHVNLNETCNAFWDFSTVNFFRSGGGCRNTGEIAAVFDHEWGHGMDDNDAAGALSNSSEAYADIAAIYRLQTSCLGHGFFETIDDGCGKTPDGTGFNVNETQTSGPSYCATDCSGVRDADFAKHVPPAPATPLGFVCNQCFSGSGPCGRQVHCAAAPVRQAAWDLVARDLAGPPFDLDRASAFMIGNRLFYLGSGNVGAWHSCTCGGTANGCGAGNGYMQWLAVDDDNGDLSDGTPHMSAIFNAFDRHGIACPAPVAQNSGCAGGPAEAPVVTLARGNSQVPVSWTPVAGAQRYWVFRTDGFAGCDFGKTRIADVADTLFVDNEVTNGRVYNYNVVAVGSSSSCFSPMSVCRSVIPEVGPTGTIKGTVTSAATGLPIKGARISDALVLSTLTDAAGRYEQHIPAGTYAVTASAGGYRPRTVTDVEITDGGETTADFSLDPRTASKVAINAGNGQTGVVGSPVSIPPSVIVRDDENQPVIGATVTFTVASGGGSILGSATQVTNGAGIATLEGWTLGPSSGPNSLTATVAPAFPGNIVTFDATAIVLSVSINDVYVAEGDEGRRDAVFTLGLSAPVPAGVTASVDFATQNGTAQSVGAASSNPSSIAIPSVGPATPYPSTITMPPVPGVVNRVRVTLHGFKHIWPDDVDVLLVGPGGQSVFLMSDCGGSSTVEDVTLTFDDAGPALTASRLVSGTFRPTNIQDQLGTDAFVAPAPPPPYGTALQVFNGISPVGTWRLFVMDDTGGLIGSIVGGWSLTVESNEAGDYYTSGGTATFPPGATTASVAVSVLGDLKNEPTETFFVNLGQPVNVTIADGQGQGNILNDDFPERDVFWTSRVGASAAGSTLTKTGSTMAWDAGAVSSRSITSSSGTAYVEFMASETTTHRMCGLSNGDAGAGFDDIDYAIYLVAGGSVAVYEGGAGRGFFGTYAPGDRFRVEVNGGVVRYKKNGSVFYTSAMTPRFPLLVDTSLLSPGATLTGVVIRGPLSANQPPVARPGGPYIAAAGEPIKFDGSGSTDPDGGVVSYSWSFGDGSTGTGPTPTHTYAAPGPYSVVLVVADNEGTTNAALIVVSVFAAPPIADVVWTHKVGVSATGNSLSKTSTTAAWDAGATSTKAIVSGFGFVEFTATETTTHRMCGLGNGDAGPGFDDIEFAIYLVPGGGVAVYEGGNGRGFFGTYAPGDRFRVEVTEDIVRYKKNGTIFYTSTVTAQPPFVADASLLSPGATLTNVVISGLFPANVPPVANAGGPYATMGEPVMFDGRGSTDSDGSIVSYQWDFGDGSTGTGPTPTHTYASTGSFTATLAVTDDAGETATASASVAISDAPPVQNVAWTNAMGVAVSGNSLSKTAMTTTWDSGAVSSKSLSSGFGFVEFTATETTTHRMCGLSNGDAGQGFEDVDFALYLMAGGSIAVYESGAGRGVLGTYVAGDRFRVEVSGGVVRYKKNGTVFYTSTVTPHFPLLVDTSLLTPAATLTNVVIAGTFPPNQPPVANAGGPYTAATGELVAFDGRGSLDPDGSLASYEWAFGDGATGTGPTPTHAYELVGTFTATLTVTDSDGVSATATASVAVSPAPPIADVVWENRMGVSVSGNSLSKTGSGMAWDAGAVSTAIIAWGTGYVEFTATETTSHRMCGLGNGDSGQGYSDIEYALYLTGGGSVAIYESGVGRGFFGSYVSGDRFRVEVGGGVVRYKKNGVVFYTSTATPHYPLLVDTSLFSPGATLTNVVSSGMPFASTPGSMERATE